MQSQSVSAQNQKKESQSVSSTTTASPKPSAFRKKHIIHVFQQKTEKNGKENSEKCVYLNLIFEDETQTQVQTQCVDILSSCMAFEVITKRDLVKVEVIDYDSMKKLSKISLRGIDREFKYTHHERKSQIAVTIERQESRLPHQESQSQKQTEGLSQKVSKRSQVSTGAEDSE